MGGPSNKRWMVGDARWNSRDKQRVEEQFRRMVRTPKNPGGRIRREPCPFCVREYLPGMVPDRDSQFHHLDYRNPFLGVWCCNSHHRRIEHGTVTVLKKDVWDYSSIVAPLLRPGAVVRGTGEQAA